MNNIKLFCINSSELKIHSFNSRYGESFKNTFKGEDKFKKIIYDKKHKNVPDYILLESKNGIYYELITGIRIDFIKNNKTDEIHPFPLFITDPVCFGDKTIKKALESYRDIDLDKFAKRLESFNSYGMISLDKHNKKILDLKHEELEKKDESSKILNKILLYKNNIK